MITILNTHANQSFSIGDRMVPLNEQMSLEDAKIIDEQYPGVYLTITEPTDQAGQAVATTGRSRTAKTTGTAETAE